MNDKIINDAIIEDEPGKNNRKLKKDPLRRAEALKANLLRRKLQQARNDSE